ncbi:Chitin synthase, class 7 [Phlyctochytrium planicorne]|nr:Chitin synthase, class 7 [Phlyctochytrium planicorne]
MSTRQSTAFSFGSFDYFCSQVPLTVCPLVGKSEGGINPSCYSRNIEIVGGMLIFEPATLVIHLIALIMTGIMIYHIKSKYTAVGRKEIVMVFYMYALTIVIEFLLVSGIVPTAFAGYRYITAAHVGMIVATLWCLFLNGFVGFQWTEDGTPMSLWSIRLSSAFIFAVVFLVSLFTFESRSPFSKETPTGLFIVYLVFSLAFLLIYVVLQIILVVNTLDDRWPLGDLLFGLTFFVLGQIFEFVLSPLVCNMATHYIDGLFFGTICTLLGVMMVYKYWDSITKEDLEFSVGGKSNVWEIRDPLIGEGGDAMREYDHPRY